MAGRRRLGELAAKPIIDHREGGLDMSIYKATTVPTTQPAEANGIQHKTTALVTGASRGIGRAIALALAETDSHVLVHYGRSEQEAESLVSEIQTKGGRA